MKWRGMATRAVVWCVVVSNGLHTYVTVGDFNGQKLANDSVAGNSSQQVALRLSIYESILPAT